jgi:hypothetical protein
MEKNMAEGENKLIQDVLEDDSGEITLKTIQASADLIEMRLDALCNRIESIETLLSRILRRSRGGTPRWYPLPDQIKSEGTDNE